MALHDEMDIEKDEQQMPEGEPHLDRMAQQVQNLFKLKKVYDQVDFKAYQHMEITKAIIKITDSLGGSDLIQNSYVDVKTVPLFSMGETDRAFLVIATSRFF